MNRIIRMCWISLSVCLLLSACSNPPTRDLDTARKAIDAVVSEGAEYFMPSELRILNNKLQEAEHEIAVQDSSTLKNYRLARFLLRQVVFGAEELQFKLTEHKAALRGTAYSALQQAESVIDDAKSLLVIATEHRIESIDLAGLQREIGTLEVTLLDIPPLIDAEEFSVASAQANDVTARALILSWTVSETLDQKAILPE